MFESFKIIDACNVRCCWNFRQQMVDGYQFSHCVDNYLCWILQVKVWFWNSVVVLIHVCVHFSEGKCFNWWKLILSETIAATG